MTGWLKNIVDSIQMANLFKIRSHSALSYTNLSLDVTNESLMLTSREKNHHVLNWKTKIV